MSLTAGQRLGVYDLTAQIGEGGMGQVYRATDTRLKRQVAIKTLPPSLAADADRLARFQREAEVLASLNHPHIAGIYGLEESDGVFALVMELVEGDDLSQRIARGAMPIDEALPIAKQIAEALEAAHEQGIVHRDLKPANIRLRPDGTIKVLDFGLAKPLEQTPLPSGLTQSPTVLSPGPTLVGVIQGTAAYMAPEQARGRPVDKRADIWAFGSVLFEMLTGRRVFEGDDIASTLAAVLKSDPAWSALPAAVPADVRGLLTRCLHKDPKARLRDIGEARIAIDRVLSGAVEEAAPAVTVRRAPVWRRAAIPAASFLAGSLATGAVVSFAVRSSVPRPRVSRVHITPPSTAALTINGTTRDVALTPDGLRLIYVGANGTTLFVRPLDQLEATPLVRGVGPRDPFVSPDSQWVGFFDGPFTLKKVAISGGPPVLVSLIDGAERGATWTSDGTIIFATASATTGLQLVSAEGGVAAVLTQPDRGRGEAAHIWPHLLPGGEGVVYTVLAAAGGLEAASIAVLDLRSRQSTILLRGGSSAQYVPSGHLVYAAAGALRAIGFDPTRAMLVGQAAIVVPQVLTTAVGAANAMLASDGTLVYVAGNARSGDRTFDWVDRQGHETPIAAQAGAYFNPRISPDGTRIALMANFEGGIDVWLWDVLRTGMARITLDPADDANPVWMPDGRVVFSSARSGAHNLFIQAADSNSGAERLTESKNLQFPTAVSPDGASLIFTDRSPTTGEDVMALRLDGPRKVLPVIGPNAPFRRASIGV